MWRAIAMALTRIVLEGPTSSPDLSRCGLSLGVSFYTSKKNGQAKQVAATKADFIADFGLLHFSAQS
jgi:hypothetical protein